MILISPCELPTHTTTPHVVATTRELHPFQTSSVEPGVFGPDWRVVFTYPVPTGAFPPSSLAELQEWGNFIGRIENPHVASLWRRLCSLYRGTPLPAAMPGADLGSFQLAWDTGTLHLNVLVSPAGELEWFFMDRATGDSDGGDLRSDLSQFVQRLRHVSES